MKFCLNYALLAICTCFVPVWTACNEPINIYDDFKCKPIYRRNDYGRKQCPLAFDCSHITNDNNQCFYNGIYYNVGDFINEVDQNLPSCAINCECTSALTFDCLVRICEFNPPSQDCYNTYDLSRCCSKGSHCPNCKTLRCNGLEGTALYGQIFLSPTVPCTVCECYPGYTGQPNDPHCKKAICDSELYQSYFVQSYCAPVYLVRTDCCPMDFICPSTDDIWECKANSLDLKADCYYQCQYGDYFYNIGSKFKRVEFIDNQPVYTRCECVIPPFFTCVRDPPPLNRQN